MSSGVGVIPRSTNPEHLIQNAIVNGLNMDKTTARYKGIGILCYVTMDNGKKWYLFIGLCCLGSAIEELLRVHHDMPYEFQARIFSLISFNSLYRS